MSHVTASRRFGPCVRAPLLKGVWAAGVDEPDSGVVRRRGVTAGYLPQEPDLDEGLSALEAVLHSGSELARCVRAYEAALAGADRQVQL